MRPVPSTWPCTTWPPRRSAGRSGSSRFTRAPGVAAPSDVRRKVSSMTSAAKTPPSTPVAVRHTPFTATESPRARSAASAERTRSRPSACESTVPRSWTRPVNMALPAPHAGAYEDIVVHLLALECEGAHGLGDGLDALGLDRVARGLAAEEQRRDEEPQLVDLVGVEESAGELRSPLEQDGGDALLPEPVEGAGHAGTGVRARGEDDLGAGGGERLGVGPRRGAGHDDGERRVGRGLDELRRERQAGGGVEDDAARLAAHALDPRRELRVVGERRADPDGDGVALGPPVVGEAAGARAGDPLRVAGRGGDLPVERHRGLEEDPRPPRAGVLAEGLVQRAGAGGEVPVGDLDLDPLVTQDPDPATGGLR